MKLSRLLSVIKPLSVTGCAEVEISGLSEDSRTVEKEFLFFARKGTKLSGLNYISEAVRKGAAAIVTEEQLAALPIPVIRVPSIADAESNIADKFYEHPSGALTIVGITGTNGKTTFTYLLEAVAKEMGWRVGVIGTVNYRLPQKESEAIEILPAPNTTPNALELQKLLHILRERKTDLVLMEVSSHALALGRVDAVDFDGAVFTNLTQDHLDFHRSLENYFNAKAQLFQRMRPQAKTKPAEAQDKARCDKFSIINLDDPYGKRMAAISTVPVWGVGIKSETNFMAKEIALKPSGTSFQLIVPSARIPVNLNLIGEHNVYNALAAAAAAVRLQIPVAVVAKGLEKIKAIPGRLESVDCGQDFTVLVDYAHTEDALKNVLQALRPLTSGRILTLFGCGGDRDRSKRPLMGAAAAHLSDWVIVSSDNPRSEDPEKIALEIEVGIRSAGKKNYEIVLDRAEAIGKILKTARKGDIVLLAGKGHESYQIFSDRTIHFDDREIVQKILCCR